MKKYGIFADKASVDIVKKLIKLKPSDIFEVRQLTPAEKVKYSIEDNIEMIVMFTMKRQDFRALLKMYNSFGKIFNNVNIKRKG